jgi:uncharacterized protein
LIEKTFKWFASFSEKWPWAVLAVTLAITALAVWGMTMIHQEYGYKTMLPKQYESVKAIEMLEDDFGGISTESVLIEADDVLRGDILRRVAGYQAYLQGFDGTEEGETQLYDNFLTEVTTPLDQMVYIPPDGSMDPANPVPLLSRVPELSDSELTAQVEANITLSQEQAQKMGMAGGYRDSIDPGHQAMLLKVKLNPDLNTNEQIKLAQPFVDATGEYFQEPDGLEVFVSGAATQNADSNKTMMKDTGILFLLAFVFILIILYITFRRFTDVLLTLQVIIVTVIWVMGLSGWLNFPYSYSSSGIMPLLLGIDIAYAIHVMSRYYEERRKGSDPYTASTTSVVTVGVAVFLTAATTAFGFVSFGISSLPPIVQFGMLCVAGVIFAFILAVTMLPATIVLRDRSPRAQEKWERKNRKRMDKEGETWLDRSLAQVAVLSEHHRVVVGIVTLLILVACIVLSFRLSTETDMQKMMPQDTPSAIAQNEIYGYFGGQNQGITLVHGEILEPANLASMLEYEDLVSSTGERNSDGELLIDRQKVISIADMVARANNGTLPETEEGVMAVLMQLAGGNSNKSGGNNSMINQDQDAAMISLYVARGNQDEMKRITEIMRDSGEQVTGENPAITMTHTGMPVLMTDIMGTLVPTQLKTSALALILCALIVILVFKSVFFGLAATSVVFISIAVEIGALVLLGWPLDFMTVMISALVIGAGIDFGIHVTHRFREEWHYGGVEVDEAIRRTVGHVGKALLAAAVTTAGAFAIIGTSRIAFMQRFGLITALSLSVACICSLVVLPSILAWRANQVERKRKANGTEPPAVEAAVGDET